jgi:hypothetical protein
MTTTTTRTDPRQVVESIRRDPARYVENVLGFTPWSTQRRILESVRDNKRTAVRSCHGSGKTAIAARCVLWFLAAHPNSRVVTTAPTYTQVRDLLWREIAGGVSKAPPGFYGDPNMTRLEISPTWFAVGLSTRTPEHFQGHHAENLLLVVDEASGVGENIYEAAEGFLTAPGARVLLIGNPTATSGTFYRAFHSDRALYETIHIPANATPNLTGEVVPGPVARSLVSAEWVDEKREQWGEANPMYQVRVMGNFPTTADDQVLGIGQVEAAQVREVEPGEPLVIACDVARYGSDETVIAVRRGERVRLAKTYNGRSLMETVGQIIDVARSEWDERAPMRVVVDDTGLGGGVTDRLREQGYTVEGFNGGEKATEPDLYPNRRSEAWFAFAAHLPHVDLDTDDQLAADLVAPRYTLDSAGRRVVEKKDVTKKRLGRSPDRADAVLMAFAPEPRMGASFGPDLWSY